MMKVKIFLFVYIFSLNVYGGSNEVFKLDKKLMRNRQKVLIFEKGRFVGLRPMDESHVIPNLPSFIKGLKSIIKNKDIKGLERLFTEKFYCGAGNVLVKEHSGFEKCRKKLNMDEDNFWSYLKIVVDSGGCVRNEGISFPSVAWCRTANMVKYEDQSLSETYISTPLKVYERPNLNAQYVVLSSNYLFKQKSFYRNHCFKLGLSKHCGAGWRYIKSHKVQGYALDKDIEANKYHFWMTIGYDQNKFKISELRPGWIPL